jgi:hypothetical protein
MADTWSVEKTINTNIQSVSNDLAGSYPVGAGGSGSDFPHYIRFTAKRSGPANDTFSAGEVVLYMPPDALKTSYSQSIGDVDMGTAIQVAGGSKSTEQMMAGLAKKDDWFGAGTAWEAIKGSFNVGADTAKAAGALLLASAAGDVGRQAVEKASGAILNPHKAVVYQGPGGFRTFSYTFVMVPKSKQEAKEIFNIVRFFKLRMHPEVGSGGINEISSVTLTYPDEFEIKYYVNGRSVDGSDATKPLFKIHNCFMETFAVDYTTSSLVSFMDDEQPLTTTMSLSFKETQLITKADIRKGY